MSDITTETEHRLLSALTYDPTDIQRSVSEGLTASDFLNGSGEIFRAMCKLSIEGAGIDALSVHRCMSGLGGSSVPDIPALAQILFTEPTALHRRQLTADVIALSRRRRLRASAQGILAEIDKPAESWADTWERVSPHLNAAQRVEGHQHTRSLSEIVLNAKKLLQPADNSGLQGPFRAWDLDSRRLRPGELCVLAARPGVGKSALATQYAAACVASGLTAQLFSLEMSHEEILARLAIQSTRSDDPAIASPAIDRIAAQKYLIHEARECRSLQQIESRARLAAATAQIGLVIVDYLQLVTPPPESKKEQRERQVAEMSRRFKLLAGELRCPILLLAQLNRDVEREGNRHPRLSDLRESGAIEQDADAVWFLHQPDATDGAVATVRLIQAKRRNWQPNIYITLGFTRKIVSFNPIHQ